MFALTVCGGIKHSWSALTPCFVTARAGSEGLVEHLLRGGRSAPRRRLPTEFQDPAICCICSALGTCRPGYFRMEHDSPVESVGAARLTVAIVFLAVTIWLVPGLFGRQLGELESFLPPELGAVGPPTSPASSANLQHEAGWILNDYDGAIQEAKQENKLVFVDFTGYTCTNCRWMEANMFPRPEVAREMNKFVRVRLYTDGAGELFEHQQKMQQEKFGTVALPYYAILRTDGSPVATFPGLTRNTAEFLGFRQSDSRQ